MALSLLPTEQTVLLSVDGYEQSEAAVNCTLCHYVLELCVIVSG